MGMSSSSAIRLVPRLGVNGQNTRELIRRKPLKHDRTIRREHCVKGSQAVTVCIAAMAEDNRAIVALADKAVSFMRNDEVVLKAEVGVTKIRELADDWLGLISGPIGFGETVLTWASENYRNDSAKRSMAEHVKLSYQAARRIEVVDRILTPRMLDENWYREKSRSANETDGFFGQISDMINEYRLHSSLLVCGFDKDIAEIYIISDPGVQHSSSSEGFGVVGIGHVTANNRLFTLETDPRNSLGSVLYDLYDAKESCAESLEGIGHECNATVLIKGRRAIQVPENIMTIIEQLYKGHRKSPFDPPSRLPRNWKRTLEAWSALVLDEEKAIVPLRSVRAQRDC
jgi:hypothetical protein